MWRESNAKGYNLNFIFGDECGRGKLLNSVPTCPIWGEPMENELSKPDAEDPGLGVG